VTIAAYQVEHPCPKKNVNKLYNKHKSSAWNAARKGTHAKAVLVADVLKKNHQ
jgi:hypothetical protein